jgi:hypothetical protein
MQPIRCKNSEFFHISHLRHLPTLKPARRI